jgi:hypothetical protein
MLPLEVRFHALGRLLEAHATLWRPAPFHEPRPAWCRRYPGLTLRLLTLDDAEVARLAGNNHALIDFAARHLGLPELATLHKLIELPRTDGAITSHVYAVPGRKQAEVEAFAAAIADGTHPVLEWCAGKGHLGRKLAVSRPVLSLEWNGELCSAGRELAARAGVDQAFVEIDVLDAAAAAHMPGRHAVALHACGELHLTLLREGAAAAVPALDLSPCCYYRIPAREYQPLNPDAGLRLSRDELHLAVTETVAAGARERRQRDRDQAWKLAFLEVRAKAGIRRGTTFKPVPAAWYEAGFAAWMQRLAAREGVALPAALDWDDLEQRGWARLREMRRLELLRLAFRRPLEVWLALDRALYLERRGYVVSLAEFCPRELTPRNLLISARRPEAGAMASSASEIGRAHV